MLIILSEIKMKITRTVIERLFSIVLLNILALSSVAHAKDDVVLQLKWTHQFQFAGFYAAQSQGFFADEGLQVEIREVDQNRSTSDIVLSGEAQFGISDAGLVLSRLQGKPVVAIAAIFQHSPLVLLTLESSDIISPLDLKGKRVMFKKSIDDAVLVAMFMEMGLTESQYVHVPHSFNDDALINENDNIDVMSAYITDQVYYYRKQKIPINIMSPVNYGIDFYGEMIFVEQQYLVDNKEQVAAFRRASIKGWHYAIDHPDEIIDWMLNNLVMKKNRSQLLFEAQGTIRLIRSQLVELGYFSTQRLHRIADIYKELKLVPQDAQFEGIHYKNYYSTTPLNKRWLQIAGLILLTLLVVVPVLWVINRKLKQQVAFRTQELEQLNHSMAGYLKVIDHYTVTCSTSIDNKITAVSSAFCTLCGYTEQEILGNTPAMFHHPNLDVDIIKQLKHALHSQQCWAGELIYNSKQGQDFWLYCEIDPQRNKQGEVTGFTSVSVDITDKKKVESLSLTDSLTGLANRRHLDTMFDKEIARARRHRTDLSIVMIDIDHFKRVNDRYGHVIGDEVIKGFANLLLANVRQDDTAGRWGGEEFLLILPTTDLVGAERIANLLRTAIALYEFPTDDPQSCSFGAAQWNHSESLDCLLGRADKALYQAKENGRNRIELA